MRIALLGDIALVGKYDLEQNPKAKQRLEWLAAELSCYDYVVANLETPLTDKQKSLIPKSMHLRSSKLNVELLKFLNIKAVTLANNHIYDFGKNALLETIETLNRNCIEWFGLNGKNLVKQIAGERLSFSGYCCYSTNGVKYSADSHKFGINLLSLKNLNKQLAYDKTNNCMSVFSVHWGQEHTNYPNYEHIALARKISENNNVIIHGHHPHIIQGIEKIKDSVIAYSLGNCVFDDCESINKSFKLKQNDENRKSFILDITIENSKITDFQTPGFYDNELKGIANLEIESELNKISEIFLSDIDPEDYETMRKSQYQHTIQEKFGKRDLKWLLTRLNYYSLGARFSSFFRTRKYRKIMKEFLSN
jgi:poly-gamma-glutamate synthesis protein (capsule biosynthesis protein)